MITSPAINPGLQKGATTDFLSDAGASLTSVLLPALVEDVSVLWAFPWDMIIWWVSQTHVMYLIQHVHFSEHFIPSTICHSNSDISASLSVGHHFVSRLPGAGLALSLRYPLGSSNVKVCIPRKCLQVQKLSFLPLWPRLLNWAPSQSSPIDIPLPHPVRGCAGRSHSSFRVWSLSSLRPSISLAGLCCHWTLIIGMAVRRGDGSSFWGEWILSVVSQCWEKC